MSSDRAADLNRLTITPKGIVYHDRGLDSFIARASAQVLKALRLVVIDFRMQVFGLYFGHLWLLLEPALQAGAYYFLLKVVFRAQGADATFAFFFIGITFWRSHAVLLSTAPYFFVSKGYSYIEQGFGLAPAILETLFSELSLLLLRLTVLFAFIIAIGDPPKLGWLAVPLVIATQMLFTSALFLILAMLGVLFKDTGKVISHIVWLWWFLSPGLYSIPRIPDWAMFIYRANPFFYLVPSYHELILQGHWSETNMVGCLVIALLSTLLLVWASRQISRFSYRIVHYV